MMPADRLPDAVVGSCAICGRDLWSDGLAPARDGNAWICGDCDQARNFQPEVEKAPSTTTNERRGVLPPM
jgi:hypothetical protein